MSEVDTQNGGQDGPCPKKRKHSNGDASRKWTENENCYFSSYANVELHRTMIEDQARTDTYRNAIFNQSEWLKGKVVVDVGCGTGILSMFCAQAGAKKVYAIDASSIANNAKQLVIENNFSDVITVLKGKAEEIELPEKVDAIVSEWMGYMLLFESMLSSILHIRDKYLKPDGRMFPHQANIYMALGDTNHMRQYQENIYDFWVSLQHTYKLDMASLADTEVGKYKSSAQVHMVPQEDVVSRSTKVCTLDLHTIQSSDLTEVTKSFKLRSMGSRLLNSFILWFDVTFPDGTILSTSPDHECTHWQNTVLPLDEYPVKQDTRVEGTIRIVQNREYFRYLNIHVNFSVGGGSEHVRVFTMDDEEDD